jgi:AhpD family alkylhydroperoxidase
VLPEASPADPGTDLNGSDEFPVNAARAIIRAVQRVMARLRRTMLFAPRRSWGERLRAVGRPLSGSGVRSFIGGVLFGVALLIGGTRELLVGDLLEGLAAIPIGAALLWACTKCLDFHANEARAEQRSYESLMRRARGEPEPEPTDVDP